MRRFDLSGPIREGMWTYGAPLPEVRIRRVASLERDGWDAHVLHAPNLLGTSIETAAHLQPDRPTIEEIPLDRFFARAVVLQLEEKPRRGVIEQEELQKAAAPIEPGMAILVATGWDRMWDDPRYYWDSPHFTHEAMEWLAARKPAILGVDISSNSDPYGREGLNHLIFDAGALLLGPLANLRRLSQPYVDLICLPLNIPGLSGTPCRPVAIEE